MKTIEQYEVEIASKAEIIEQQLAVFQENIGQIGSVIGKDSTQVYELLVSQYNDVINTYTTTTRRNAPILQGYVTKLDKILAVLAEVMASIEKIESNHGEDLLSTRYDVEIAMEQANEMAMNLAIGAQEELKEKGLDVSTDVLRYGMIGGTAYLVLSLLGAGKTFSLAGAAATAYMVGQQGEEKATG